MNAGKSTVLLQASHNYVERGMQTYLLTASFDDRAGAAKQAGNKNYTQVKVAGSNHFFDGKEDELVAWLEWVGFYFLYFNIGNGANYIVSRNIF